MKYYLSDFKKPIDPKNPLLFFFNLLTEEKFNIFLNKLYPIDKLGFTKLDNGKYSFYAHTGFYNEYMDLIESTELYEGSIYNNLEEVLNFYYIEIDMLLETRKMKHLYESKRIDDKYSEHLINNIDCFLNTFEFIRDESAKGIIIETLNKIRRLLNNSLSYSVQTPIRQEIIDFTPQYSYLLGDVTKNNIEKIFMIAESDFLIDIERIDLDIFYDVFFSVNQNQKTQQILFSPNRTKVTALMYALSSIYEGFTFSKVELSNAFYYMGKNNKPTKITQSALYTHHSRCKDTSEYLLYYNKYIRDLK
jgi:hypothetical protein